ncbi:hypothetical protein A2U94_13590 [Bacillus sp. VT 712]|nr:hypothetical protein A2U94_13590 [Bacillus sp. VT 712]
MKKLSIILIVQNDEATIRQVIRSTRCLNPHEVIVLAKQSMDGSVLIAKEEGCIVKIENGEETAHEFPKLKARLSMAFPFSNESTPRNYAKVPVTVREAVSQSFHTCYKSFLCTAVHLRCKPSHMSPFCLMKSL